jgi:hypothetical protein
MTENQFGKRSDEILVMMMVKCQRDIGFDVTCPSTI